MRRLALAVLLLLLPWALPVAAAPEPVLDATAYLLMDSATGEVLIEYEGDTPLPIASTTKIMTAILAIERGRLDDLVTVGQKPYETGGSTIWLEIGEQQRLEDLLYALMLESANDAAVAIAEHLAGSEERFAGWMNEKARALGATRTNFVNSHGLHDPEHYSTAHDLALIARYAMQNEHFRRIITVAEVEIPGAGGNAPRHLVNHNRLLGYYDGAIGVKNGFTEEAGNTNVASARRGESELIAVVLNSPRVWTASMALLDFGFLALERRAAVEEVAEPPGLPDPVVYQPVAVVTAPAAPVAEPVAEAAGGGEPWLWLLLWIGGAGWLTFQLNGLRDKGGIAGGAA